MASRPSKVAAQRDPNSTYILGARARPAGEDAVKKVRDVGVTVRTEVAFELDVKDDEEIAAVVKGIGTKFGELEGTFSHLAFLPLPQTFARHVCAPSNVGSFRNTVLINNAGISDPMRPPPTEPFCRGDPKITTFVVFSEHRRAPEDGAEATVRLALEDGLKFEGCSFVEWVGERT
ncbi:short chain dehydrogenase/reductase family protein [Apiospora rasikravindrae]|uniref:Short chain dehydrogenase/reductase family protein n=1 Tax=Apiospora rasikravindrae TaxID=990691 RepID=A0ABR1S528_9PEZI